MKHASEQTLDEIEPFLMKIREFSMLRERRSGYFYRGQRSFMHFHQDATGIYADVRFVADEPFRRVRATTEAEQLELFASIRDSLAQ